MPRLLKGALLGPLIFSALLLVLMSVFYSEDITADPEQGKQIVTLITLGALLFTNLLVFCLGWPYYNYLKRKNSVTRRNILLGGAGIMACLSTIISLYLHITNIWQIIGQLLIYALCGTFVAYWVWYYGIKE